MVIKFLDLCCKAGGCSVGYYRAAKELGLEIEITGVDIEPQPNYPFKFVQADAVEYFNDNHHLFTHFHASPPCQPFSNSTFKARSTGKVYKDNLTLIQESFKRISNPCVIENVPNAPIRNDVTLYGYMFGLKLLRKRFFELHNWFMLAAMPPQKKGTCIAGDFAQVYGKGQLRAPRSDVKYKVPGNGVKEVWSNAMGIDWMTIPELAEAIPPAYTHYIGLHLFEYQKRPFSVE